jgi:hypothetical protein
MMLPLGVEQVVGSAFLPNEVRVGLSLPCLEGNRG